MSSYSSELTTHNKEFFVDRYIDILRKKHYPDEKLNEYIEIGNSLWNSVKDLPYGFCHGDLHRGNLLKAKDDKIYMLDLDTACFAPQLFDIAVMCDTTDYFNFDNKEFGHTTDNFNKFINEYSKYNQIDFTINQFYNFIALRHFQLQATIVEIYGLDCIDEEFIDKQLDWIKQWRKQYKWIYKGIIRMAELIAYHVVTEKPMHKGQHIVFDEIHHNGVWKRVNEKLDIVNDIYNNPEKHKNIELEHHISVALRELALEKVRVNKYPNFPSRMACLYVSKTLEEAEKWFDYFVNLERPTFQIVKLKVNGNVFYGDAEKCFEGRLTENENLILAEKYWENKDFDKSSILEMLVDGNIEVVEIVKEL